MSNLIEVHPKDYVVVQTTKEKGGVNKPQLIKVRQVNGLNVVGILQKDPHIKQVSVEAKITEVLTNLGPKPKPGKVYGYDLARLYVATREHEWAGDVYFFSRPDEVNGEKLWKALSAVPKILKRKGFEKLGTSCSYLLEIHPKQGKYAGMYIHSRDSEKNPHRIHISASDSTIDKASVGNYNYVVIHELMHAIDFQLLAKFPKLKSRWLELFHTSIAARFVKAERCDEILKVLLKKADLKTVLGEADDEFKADLKLILKWLREFRNITARELQLMLTVSSEASRQSVKDVWPKVNVRSKKLKPVVSEYACKNYRELFAEACTFFLLDQELPKEIAALCEESLTLANRNADSIGAV